MKIVVTGSIAYDYLMFFPGRFTDHLLPDHLDNVNLSFLVDSMKRQREGMRQTLATPWGCCGATRPLWRPPGRILASIAPGWKNTA